MSASASFSSKYELLDRLGKGGMAEIFLARVRGFEGFEKHMVIKRILPKHLGDTAFVAMFLDEARLSARLHHQNIVQIYDIGRADGTYFFSMEYIHGVDLSTLFKGLASKRARLPMQQALTIACGVAAGLDYAHNLTGSDGRRLELVHRDVSPSNIMVTYDGGVKLVDFGIARARERVTTTRTGQVKGKISYMSPEQCQSQPVDRRSDIFSFGIVLYELTTSRRLFRLRDSSDYEIMHRIVSGDVPRPSSFDASYPPELEAIVMRALSSARDKRYSSVRELLVELEAVAGELKQPLSTAALAEFLVDMLGRKPEPWVGAKDGAKPVRAPGPVPPPTPSLPLAQVTPMADDLAGAETVSTFVAPARRAGAASAGAVRQRRNRSWLLGLVISAALVGGLLIWWAGQGGAVDSEARLQSVASSSLAPPSPEFERAAQPSSSSTNVADHVQLGHSHFAVGDFEAALGEFVAAFAAEPAPELLLHIGACHRQVGDRGQAIASYQRYLAEAPEAANRAQVEALIAELTTEAAVAAEPSGAQPPAAETSASTTAQKQPTRKRTRPTRATRRKPSGKTPTSDRQPKGSDLLDRTW